MPINLTCQCGQKLAVKEKLAGKTVKCPKCGKPVVVARVQSPQVKSGDSQTTQPEHSSMADLLDEVGITASRTGRRCPECGYDMIQAAIICIGCGFNTETGRRIRTKRDIIDDRE